MKVGSLWEAFPFFGYPTSIWHSVSYDAINWQTDATSTLPLPASPFYGLAACNQIADPSFIEFNNQINLYWSANDNANTAGNIGLAIYPGTLSQFEACNPNPTSTTGHWTVWEYINNLRRH